MAAVRRSHVAAAKPWKLITSDDPNLTLGEGRMRHYKTLIEAANALAKTPEPHCQIVYDNGYDEQRFLTAREQRFLDAVCDRLGVELID